MISHIARCAYIHPPKTGGHSIDVYFRQRRLVSVDCWHASARETRRLLGRRKNYYFFATVRNPWDRFVSEYFWQKSDSENQISTPWGNKTISFGDFCRSDFSWYPELERQDGHLGDQSEFLFDDEDRLLVDQIIRFERLQQGFDDVCRKLRLDRGVLPHLNRTQHEPYWRYYTDDLAALIGQRFARDVRLFGYRFGD